VNFSMEMGAIAVLIHERAWTRRAGGRSSRVMDTIIPHDLWVLCGKSPSLVFVNDGGGLRRDDAKTFRGAARPSSGSSTE
jgi:hypothetical protein